MKISYFLSVFALVAGSIFSAAAQTKPAASPAPVPTSSNAQFLMHDGAVVLRQGNSTQALTQNVRLSNGTKINYKSGIVELPGRKMTTLHEGDYVTPKGDIVFATPTSAAAARGEQPSNTAAQFTPYIEVGTSSADMQAYIAKQNKQIELLSRKVELLNQKVGLLSGGTAKPDTGALDQQLRTLDEQLQQVQ